MHLWSKGERGCEVRTFPRVEVLVRHDFQRAERCSGSGSCRNVLGFKLHFVISSSHFFSCYLVELQLGVRMLIFEWCDVYVRHLLI